MIHILNWLKEIREDQKLSQEEAANRIGITRQYYNAIENGKRGDPLNVDMAKKISKALNFKNYNLKWTKFYEENEEAKII